MTRSLRWPCLALMLCSVVLGACAPSPEKEWVEAARVADGPELQPKLQAFLDRPVPQGIHRDDARVLRHDAAYRLSRLALGRGEPEAAERIATAALEEGRAEDVFTANLLVARGQALEALGRPVRATLDYHDALLINEALLEAALREPDEDDR